MSDREREAAALRRFREADPAALVREEALDRVAQRLKAARASARPSPARRRRRRWVVAFALLVPAAFAATLKWLAPSVTTHQGQAAEASRKTDANTSRLGAATELNPGSVSPALTHGTTSQPSNATESKYATAKRGTGAAAALGSATKPSGRTADRTAITSATTAVHPANPSQRPPTDSAPASPEPSSEETSLLKTAFRQLNIARSPDAALQTLDVYRERFPQGQLRREAALMRVDALSRSGRKDGLLAALEQVDSEADPEARRLDLRLWRAELYTEAKRCREALPLFDDLLTHLDPGQLEERALFGRAVCRGNLGDAPGQLRDLNRYLHDYPDGRFANSSRAVLGNLQEGTR